MAPSSFLPAGAILGGDFVIVRPLDEGGMGRVYLVDQQSTGRRRALKVMHRELDADPSLAKRFEQEARIGARIPSEHVVEVIAAGVDPELGLPYLVMELLEGEDLRARIDRAGALPHDDVRAIFEALCHAMAAAHAAGVVHRDLKPENVFLAVSRRAGGGDFTVKVLDFGIAKLAIEARTGSTKTGLGSPMWMAPEQTAPGPITAAADVWPLGLLAYELFTGRPFWRAANDEAATTAQLLREVVLDPLPAATVRAAEQRVAERLPAGFDGWFALCLTREPAARFADGGLVWRGMQRLFATGDALAETAVDPSRPSTARALPPSATGDATLFHAATPPASGLPTALPQETPVATVHRASPTRPISARGWVAIALGSVIAVAGLTAGWVLSHGPAPAPQPANAAPTLSVAPSALPPALASASAPSSEPVRPATAAAPRAASPVVRADGFRESAAGPPTQWSFAGRGVRLLYRLVTNDGNVAPSVVRKAVEHEGWTYLQCYERAFGGLKDLDEGTVTIAFDILEQLPRHASLEASTFTSATFNACVVDRLLGQTINAAGPEGKGHVVYAFRFVPS